MTTPAVQTDKTGTRSRVGPASSWVTEGSVPLGILRIALPTWGAFFTHDLMGVVDMFFVGKLGPAAMASVAMGSMVMGILAMVGHGVTAGTTALVANAFGRGDRADAGRTAAQSVTVVMALSALLAALGVPLARTAMVLLGAGPEVVPDGAAYVRVLTGGCFVMMGMMSFGATLRGAGDATTPFIAMVLGNVVNVVLDPIFIFGWFGMPAMGVVGSAWATIIGRSSALLIMVYVFFFDGNAILRLKVRDLKPHFQTMIDILRIGVFASGRMLVRNIAGLLLMRLVAAFGTPTVAAYGIGLRLRMFVMGPSMGFGTGASTLVGQNLGAGKPERSAKAAWTAAAMAGGIALFITLVFWVAPGRLVAVFNDDPEVIAVGAPFLRWLSATFVFMSLAFVMGHSMTGAGDTMPPMVITAVAQLLVTLPLAYWLATSWHSSTGVWVALCCSQVLEGVFAASVFLMGRWRAVGARIGRARA